MLERADYVEGRASSVSQKLRMARKDYSREGWYFVTMGAEMHRPVFMNIFKGAVTRQCRRTVPVASRYSGKEPVLIWQLLKASAKRSLRISRQATEEEVNQAKRFFVEAWEGVIVSTFFSPGERAVLDELLTHKKCRIIWIIPMGMPEQIPVKWGRALLEQRALWLSDYPDELAEATRATCMECNAWAKQLAVEARR